VTATFDECIGGTHAYSFSGRSRCNMLRFGSGTFIDKVELGNILVLALLSNRRNKVQSRGDIYTGSDGYVGSVRD
jgi:hypothetical protein